MRAGTPTIAEYRRLLESEDFKSIEAFSDDFLAVNEDLLGPYAEAWVRDPLHHWSRQWEYPFAFTAIRDYLRATGKDPAGRGLSLLDAGSGVTFFPWLLRRTYAGAVIRCCDSDERWRPLYTRIGERSGAAVELVTRTLEQTGLAENSVDVLYSISVLEHAQNLPGIIREFSRVLRPGALVVITFDVSLEKGGHPSPEEGERLLALIDRELLGGVSGGSIPRRAEGLLTTDIARSLGRPELLPWPAPTLPARMRRLARFRLPPRHPPLLTVCCVSGVTPPAVAVEADSGALGARQGQR